MSHAALPTPKQIERAGTCLYFTERYYPRRRKEHANIVLCTNHKTPLSHPTMTEAFSRYLSGPFLSCSFLSPIVHLSASVHTINALRLKLDFLNAPNWRGYSLLTNASALPTPAPAVSIRIFRKGIFCSSNILLKNRSVYLSSQRIVY